MDFRFSLLMHQKKLLKGNLSLTEKELKKSKDLAGKRSIPQGDALHALIARNHKAVMVTFDRDFQKLTDIIKPKTPRELV